MAKRSNQKLKILYLYKILLENTSEKNGMTLAQILRELQSYGIRAERRSIYDDIEALRVFGIDVRVWRDRYVRYYVAERKFDVAKISEMMIEDLKGDYKYTSGKEYIIVQGKDASNERIPINFASSGQQEVLWLLNQLYILMLKKEEAFVIIVIINTL